MKYGLKNISIILTFMYAFVFLAPISTRGNQIDDSIKLLNTNKYIYSYQNDNIYTDKIIVKYEVGVGEIEKEDIHNNLQIDELEVVEELNMEIIQLNNSADIYTVLNELNSNPSVKYAEPSYERKLIQDEVEDTNYKYSAYGSVYEPNDWYFYKQWGLTATQMVYAWDKVEAVDRGKIKVAVIDSGVDYNHTELSECVLKDEGYDFINNDSEPYDDNGHGTLVSGIIGAKTDNGNGIAGVASGVKILPVKVLDQNGEGDTSTFMSGLMYAVNNGAQVVNISFGGYEYSKAEAETVEYALNHGVIIVAASGNSGNEVSTAFPALCPGVISVGATNKDNLIAEFSNKNSQVVAPGVDIFTTKETNVYASTEGTSFSSPLVAGLAALVIASSKDYKSGDDLVNIADCSRVYQVGVAIENGCVDLGDPGFDSLYGAGIVNGKSTFENTRYFIDDDISDSSNYIRNITVKAYDYTNTLKTAVSDSVYIHIKDSQDNIYASKEVKLLGGIGVESFELDVGEYIAIVDNKDITNRIMDVGIDFTVIDHSVTPTIIDTTTPTITDTPTPTITPTITDTPIPTITPTIIDTSTPTITPTITATITPTPTKKRSSGAGFVSTVTPTQTPTQIPKPTHIYKAFKTFNDIVNHWAKNDIEIMAEKGVVKGISEDNFAPEDIITRAQFAAFLVRALGLEDVQANSYFQDVLPSTWYYESVNKAFKIGVISGVSETDFKPDIAITREQMSLMIMRAYKYISNIREVETIDLYAFGYKDVDSISTWAKESVAFSGKYGLMFGDENKYYMPKENATRAQAVSVIKRLLDKTGKL